MTYNVVDYDANVGSNDIAEVSLRKWDDHKDQHGEVHTCLNYCNPHSNTAVSWEVDSSVVEYYHPNCSTEGSSSEEDIAEVVIPVHNRTRTPRDDTRLS